MAKVHMIVERSSGIVAICSSKQKAETRMEGMEKIIISAGWVNEGSVICLGDGSYTRYTKGDKHLDYRIDSYDVE